jgi:gas vesicle protein
MKILRFLEGFFLGATLGASLAILLAPESGGDLRSRLQAQTDRVQSEVRRAASERRAELERQLSSMRAAGKPVKN